MRRQRRRHQQGRNGKRTQGPVSCTITVTLPSVSMVHSRFHMSNIITTSRRRLPCPACFVSHQRLGSVMSPDRPLAPPLHCVAVASLGVSPVSSLLCITPWRLVSPSTGSAPASSSRHEPSSRVSAALCVCNIPDALVRVPRHRRATSLPDRCSPAYVSTSASTVSLYRRATSAPVFPSSSPTSVITVVYVSRVRDVASSASMSKKPLTLPTSASRERFRWP
jgi:hypothetical protein